MAENSSSLEFFTEIKTINTPEKAQNLLKRLTNGANDTILSALSYATKAHEGQFRKDGGPYITHPILVSCVLWRR